MKVTLRTWAEVAREAWHVELDYQRKKEKTTREADGLAWEAAAQAVKLEHDRRRLMGVPVGDR